METIKQDNEAAAIFEAAYDILNEVLPGSIERGDIYTKSSASAISGVVILIGLAGDLRGRFFLDMSKDTAIKLSDAMNEQSNGEYDLLTKSTINELGNLIGGLAITKLHHLGKQVFISPPSLLTGENIEITSSNLDSMAMPLITEQGRLELNVAVKGG